MNNIKISVIIPVYNVEKYLRQCLNSIVDQTLKEIEIICVNDGSTDNSLKILEEYALKDERIKIINTKENMGSAVARKTGLNDAKGELISFIDADDWIKLDAFEKLYKNAISNNSDVIIFNFCMYDESENKYSYWKGLDIADFFGEYTDFNNFVFDYTDIKPLLLNGYTGCTKLYKTTFLRHYNFYFPKHITLGEDVPLHVQVFLKAQRISFFNEHLYIYRISNINSNSNSSILNKKILEIFTIVDEVENILIENNLMDEYKYEFFAFQLVHLNHWFGKCDKNIKNEFFNLIKKYFDKIDFNDTKINCSLYYKNQYYNIVNSESYREFELLTKINLLSNKYKHLKSSNNKLIKQLKIKEQIIHDLKSSNSWRLTKPIRKFKSSIMNIKRNIFEY